MNELRVYQKAAAFDVLRALKPGNAVILVSPTASGKTIIAAEIARKYSRVLFVAHRREIINQAREVMPEHVTCTSIQAAWAIKDDFGLLIIDEAHRSAAPTYRRLIERHCGKPLLGLTATPLRMDGKGLKGIFDEIVCASSAKELLEAGYLVPYRALEAPIEALRKLDELNVRAGDYDQRQLSHVMNRPKLVGDVVSEYQRHALGRKTIAFAVTIEHSMQMEQAFLASGIAAEHIDGHATETQRDNALQRLQSGEVDVLCSVNLFTEGWDCPPVSCVIMARPTKSLTLYLQSVGRGMRPHPGKEDLLILDHAGNINRHGYPDQEREWELESERERKKRAREIRRLERMYALGQITALNGYSLEERRLLNKTVCLTLHLKQWMSPIVGYELSDRTATQHAAQGGVASRGWGLWDREQAQALVARMGYEFEQAVRIPEAARMLGLTLSGFHAWKSRLDIKPLPGYLTGRILKTDIERIKAARAIGDRNTGFLTIEENSRLISIREIAERTGIHKPSVHQKLQKRNIAVIKNPGFYDRGACEQFIAEYLEDIKRREDVLDVREAAEIIGCGDKQVRSEMRRYGHDAIFHNAYEKDAVRQVAHLRKERNAAKRTQAEAVHT